MPPHNLTTSLFRSSPIPAGFALILAASLGLTSTTLAGASASTKLPSPQPLKTVNTKTTARPAPSGHSLQGLAPKGIYVVVDTAQNKVFVREGEKVIYTAIASTGSGASLKDPRNPNKGWVFETPRGVYAIMSKIKNPAWVKPDWAFIEEGEPVPTKSQDRVETGVLGDYALGFGNGYFIHGTLYTRLLGTNVTHGCIRVGDADLEYLYRHVPTGTTIIIY
jgi:lipoprotein-anchoring transpeptidase ErfK/SrfK